MTLMKSKEHSSLKRNAGPDMPCELKAFLQILFGIFAYIWA